MTGTAQGSVLDVIVRVGVLYVGTKQEYVPCYVYTTMSVIYVCVRSVVPVMQWHIDMAHNLQTQTQTAAYSTCPYWIPIVMRGDTF